jgi:hypothetical protein
MRKFVIAAAAALTLGASAEVAEARPGGCLKYGVGGAVAGHFAGGHRWKGALAGCALGIYQRRKHERSLARDRNRYEERGRSSQEADSRRRPRDADTTGSFARGRTY